MNRTTARKRSAAKGAASRKRTAVAPPDAEMVAEAVRHMREATDAAERELADLHEKAQLVITKNTEIAVRRIQQCKLDTMEYVCRYFDELVEERLNNADKYRREARLDRERWAGSIHMARAQARSLRGDDPALLDVIGACLKAVDVSEFALSIPCRTSLHSAKTKRGAQDDCQEVADALDLFVGRKLTPKSYDHYNDDSDDQDEDNRVSEWMDRESLLEEAALDLDAKLRPLEMDHAAKLLDQESQ